MNKSIYSYMLDEDLFALVRVLTSAQDYQILDGPLSDHEQSYLFELLSKLDRELTNRQRLLIGE